MINKEKFNEYLKSKDYDKLQDYKVDNAIIMAAGLSSRFKPISYYRPKGLCMVKNEVLIERQIKQLKEAGIDSIYIIVGYKKEMFYYLKDKYNVTIVENDSYKSRNNTGSLILIKDILANSYICSVDNYFTENVFEKYNYQGYYASVFNKGKTNEWCISVDEENIINKVVVGGKDSYVMMGHVYFDRDFSKKFIEILSKRFDEKEIKDNVWEYLYLQHLDTLKLAIKKYDSKTILEFDHIEDAVAYDDKFLINNKE